MLSCRMKGETLTASPDYERNTKDREQRKKPDIAGDHLRVLRLRVSWSEQRKKPDIAGNHY